MSLADTPFTPFRGSLYTAEELSAGFDPARPASFAETLDFRTYRHFVMQGGAAPQDSLASMLQALHDNSISQALVAHLRGEQRVVAIMGGHKLPRDSAAYRRIALLSHALSRRGFLLASGGGPGAMEATHLGALLANHDATSVEEAIGGLAVKPAMPTDTRGIVSETGVIDGAKLAELAAWWTPAFQLRRSIEDPGQSLAVPTWHYGHEPYSPLATHVAKYFQNSIREDGLLALAGAGIVYAEGKAGTLQEVFQDAAQNYYRTVGNRFSPMVFIGTEFWKETMPVDPLLRALFVKGEDDADYRRYVLYTDDVATAVSFLADRPDEGQQARLLVGAGLAQTAAPLAYDQSDDSGPREACPGTPAERTAPTVLPEGALGHEKAAARPTTLRLATFNAENLLHPDARYAERDDLPMAPGEYAEKIAWIGRILDEGRCDLVGFQEVFSSDALEAAVARSRYLSSRGCKVHTPGYEANSNGRPRPDGSQEFTGPNVALVTHLPAEVASVAEFPPGIEFTIPLGRVGGELDTTGLGVRRFERPVIHAVVELRPGVKVAVLVAHLKSKRGKFLDSETEEMQRDPRLQALAKTRSLVIRAAESTALRAMVLDILQGTPGRPPMPVILFGDLNDDVGAVTTRVIGGEPRLAPRGEEPRAHFGLFSVHDLQEQNSLRDVSYSHLFDGRYEVLDQIMLSQHFVEGSGRIADVRQTRIFNDHIADRNFWDDLPPLEPRGPTVRGQPRTRSDHGIPVTTIALR
ncbi:endonuclease/exonuclease/phosphatase family protein [Roseomonas sp. WA12]